jgi:hypothetical protein
MQAGHGQKVDGPAPHEGSPRGRGQTGLIAEKQGGEQGAVIAGQGTGQGAGDMIAQPFQES